MADGMKATKLGLVILLLAFLTVFIQATQPPTPHGITGFVLYPGGVQVPSGTHVRITNRNTAEVLNNETGIPVPGHTGYYSFSIDGNDGDNITLQAWNATGYGELNFSLSGDMDVNITLNLTRPAELNLSIVSPVNNSVFNITQLMQLNVSVVVLGGADAENCSFEVMLNETILKFLNSKIHNYSTLAYGSQFYEIWNLSPNWTGSTNITVNVSCDTDALNLFNLTQDTTTNTTIKDPFPPNVSVSSPGNGSSKNYTSLEFIYNVSDHTGVDNCTLRINNSYTNTDTSIGNRELNNFSVTLSEGHYLWNISCYDMSGNQGFSGNFLLEVDVSNPLITDVTPFTNADYNYSHTVTLHANVTDNFNISSVWVNITWNGSTNTFQMQATGSGLYEYNFTNTTYLGNYNFSIVAWDRAGNLNVTDARFFTVYGVDYEINTSSLLYVNEAVEFSRVELTTRVYKTGNLNGSNVNVSFYEGGYPSGTLINWTLFNVTSESYVDVAVNWTAKIGTWFIEAVVDPPLASNGSIQEMNESNNRFGKNITVKSYHIFYGNASYEVMLDTSGNLTIQSWSDNNWLQGNIYAVDADSNVNWDTLLALSRNTSGDYYGAAFAELDSALNMGTVNDSINATYARGGLPKATRNFSVFENEVTDVPIVNSTDYSTFVTGILWDYSDGGSVFNGSQDVVFIANFNQSSQGRFGTYDYELKVPARLREYISPNLDNTITLFVELT